MKKRLTAWLLSIMLIAATATAVRAAEADIAPSADPDAAQTAAADEAPADSDEEPDSGLPSAFSSRELGYTTAVRTQQYNTCWAYSSTAVMEVLLNKNEQGIGYLSPMDMNFRMTQHEDGTGWQRSYSESGYPYIALGYLTSIGAVTEEDVSADTLPDDYAAVSEGVLPYAYAESILYLKGGSIETVKDAVYRYGAAVGNFHYNAAMLNEATAAYYCDIVTIATANLFGHAVAIVGWDDDYDRENFVEAHRPENNGAWLCKNSWGDYWASEGGYFWISYEDKHLFDHRFGPSYAIGGFALNTDDLRLKQSELYGATYEFNYPETRDSGIDSMTYANVLDFTDGFNVIDKVVFETTSVGSEYDVFYIPTDSGNLPVTDENAWVLLYSGTVSYEGYICADVKNYAAPQGTGAVGVRLRRASDGGSIAIGVDEWLNAASRSIFIPEAKQGDCYLLGLNEGAYDLMDYYRDVLDDEIGGAFVIKTQTRRGILGDVDGDGEVTILDGTGIQRYLAAIIDFDAVQEAVADYDRDGIISILDCTRIQRMLAGIID